MKKAFSISFLFACVICFSGDAVVAQDQYSEKTTQPKAKGDQLDILRDSQDKPYVIGDDGQKVYFLADPIRKDAPTQKQPSSHTSNPMNKDLSKPE